MPYAVAVDIGGTFTDLVAYDHETHRVIYTKSPTTYGNFVEGIGDCFGKAELTPDQATFLNHGTTLVINAYIQRRGAKAALVTSRGFRDILEIARANRPDPFDLHYRRDEPLIPRSLRFEVAERTDSKGRVVTPLDLPALDALAARLRTLAVEAVAVFFMNSYANPAHEEAAAARLRAHLPGVYVTHSTELTREWYEYERTSTVAANAYVGPQVNTYIRRLESDMQGRGFAGSLFMMGSNGGLLSVDRTCRQPIGLVESGPIGGCIGAGAYAEALGFKNVVAFDMGGTTAKCALVENGRFNVESIYYAGGYVRGFPIKSPVIDIVEVGSGGGSIAWLDSQARLNVGPRSAGSMPGPVCYGRGGAEPTVEGLGGIPLSNVVARRPDPLAATAVFDHAIWHEAGRLESVPPNPRLRELGGTVIEADDLARLAAAAGLPPAVLAETVATYNAAVEAGRMAALAPARTLGRTFGQLRSSPDRLPVRPIREAPFYAVRLCVGISYTLGGIAIDARTRVLDRAGAPVPGLHAAGSCTGGIEGGPIAGYVGGLLKALCLGLVAGECVEAMNRA